jgi:hypothetical protein
MALLPTLPGINAPIDRTEQKLDKLEAKSAAKKILLAERSGMSGGATVPDPWKNHDRAVFLLEQEKLAADARNEQAIVSDDDLHTFWGSRTQEGASIATGGARLVGDVASAPATAFADAQLSGVSDEMRALYDVEQGYKSQVEGLKSAETALQFDVMSGKLGPIEAAARRLELRNQQKALVAPDTEKLKALDVRPEQRNVAQNPTGALAFAPSDYQDAGLIEQELSPRERIEAAKNALKFAGTVDKSIEGITEGVINPLKRDVLNADMNASVEANKASFTAASAAWDKGDTGSALLETGKGIAGLVKDFGANALDNPDAALEYIAENVPQLALGAAGKTGQLMMAQTNLAYGADIYRKGLEEYQAKNEGKLPTQAEATEMLGWSLSAAAAEQVGDMLTLSPLKGPLSKVMGDAFTQVKAGKLVTAAKELGRVPAAVASGVISEAPTEGYQTAVEENLSKLNTDFDFNTIAKAAGIGGIVGGGLKGGIETLVQTGDIVSGGALTALGNQADSLKDKAKGVVDADAAKVAAFEEAKTTGDVDKLIDFNADTFNPTAAITAMHHYTKTTEDDVDPEDYVQYGEGLVGVMEQQLTVKEEAVKALPEDATETDREALVQDFEATREQVASMKLAVKSWRDELSGLTTVEDIDAAVAEADTDITEADETVVAKATESTSKVMTLAMNRSSKVTPEQLEALASNTSNVLSTEQRSFLTRAADARRAINALKDVEGVSKEVFSGGNGNFGLNDYQKDFDTAHKTGNTEQATRALSELTRFTEGHRAKFNLFSRAFDASEKAGGTKTYSFLPVGNNTGKWVVAPKGMSWDAVRKKGGVNISARNSGNLLNAVEMEVKALEASAAEMSAAMKIARPVRAQASSATKKVPKPLPVQTPKDVTQLSDEETSAQPVSAPKAESVSEESKEVDALQDLTSRLDSINAVVPKDLTDWVRANGRASTVALFERLLGNPIIQAITDVQLFTPEKNSKRPEAGLYHPKSRIIQINIAESALRHQAAGRQLKASKVVDTLIHEMVHALTYDLLETNKELQAQVDHLQQQVRNWMKTKAGKALPANVRERINNSLESRHEFLTYALTDKRAQVVFSRIPVKNGTSVLRELADTLLRLLNEVLGSQAVPNSVLIEALNLTDELLTPLNDKESTPQLNATSDSSPEIGALEQKETPASQDADFEEEVSKAEADLKAAEQKQTEEADAAEAARRTQSWVDGRVAKTEARKSDYLGQTAGVLTAFKEAVVDRITANLFREKNLLSAYFKQVAQSLHSTTPRPLVAVSNFMAHVKVGDILMDEFLSHGMTEAQAPLVALFIQAHDKFVETINKVIPPSLNKKGLPNKDWYFREPVEFFRNEDGKFDANFLTAMAAGAFALLAEEVNTPMYRTNEEIAMMLGLPKETDVGRDVRNRLRPMLARRFAIENKLGQFITDSLGIKIKDENTPVGELERLRAHLGAHALNMLVELNLLQLNEVDIGTYAGKPADSVNEEDASEDEGAAGDDTINKFRTDIFVSVPRDGKKLIEPLERIKSVSKGTGGVLATLFGMESAQQMPLLEPPKVTQEDTNGGLQKVSKSVKRAMSKFASRQMSFRPAMTMLISAEQGFLEDIAGIENVEKLVMHAELRESAQAANDNLRRELEQLQDLWMHLSALGTPFRNFFSLPDQWKNSRIGYTGSWANMQTSKIARFLVSPVGWESEVVIDGSAPNKNQTSLDNFKLRVMEALGAKTDSQSDDVSLANWDKMTNDLDTAKHIVDAVAALRPVVALPVEQQKLSKEAQATIANAVLKSKTKLHGFEALVALAQYENAKAAGESSFKAIVTSEVDGKTNGPMLSMWLLGVMDSTFAAMGGFYTHVSQVRSFGQWKPGNYDLYERTASSLIGRLLSRGFEQKSLDALFNLLGSPLNEDNSISKAGRDLVKNPLTTLIYGSGLETTVEKMTDVFIENVYKTMGQIAEGKAYGAQKLTGVAAWAQYQEDLKEMSGMSQYLFPGELEQAMETPMEAAALSNLREEFKESIGKAVKDTINEDFKGYMDARKQMVRQANGVWTMYDMVRTKLLDDLTEQLMDWGEIDFQWITVDTDKVIGKDKKGRPVFEKKKVRQPLRELTPAEKAPALEAIKDMEPRINTALSKRDGQLDAGIYVSKSARKASNSPTHTTDVKGVVNGEKTNHKSKPVMRVESNPGVSIMANGVQSLDGNTIVEVLAALNLVGVHDAVLSALHDAAAAGQAMNQQVMDMLLNHSLPRESYESLERTLKGFAAYIEQNPGDISKEALGELLNSQKEDRKDPVSFTILVQRAARFAHEADYNRLDGLSQLAVVDQYTIAAGIFDVPNSFNNLAAKKRDALSPKIDPALLAIAAQLDEIVFAKKVPVAAKTAAKKTRSTQVTDFDLDALLQTEGITANEVAAKLFNSIGTPQDGDTMGKLYREILKRGIKQLQGLPIVYATSDSQIPEKAKDAYGWYHVDADGKAHLGIRGTSMGGSGVTTELVVHEILHAMVAWIIDQAEKGHGSAEVLAAVADLEALRKELKPLLEAEHSEAVSTLQEFVAWGMTNPAFQKAMAAVPMVEKGFAALKNKAQQFFRAISTIVFGVRGPAIETALSIFMARVSVIVGESETTQATQAPGTYRMAAHNFNAVGLFNGLAAQGNGYTDPYLQERVAGLMSTVVDAVGGPFQQFYQQIAQSATTPAGLVANAQQQGLMPVTAGLRTSGFALGDQQAYAIEVLTETFKAIQRDTTRAAQQQLLKLFKETSKQVTAADLGGQAQWDAIFGAEAIDTDGDYLARFAAMALAYPPLVAKMGFTTQEVVRESTTLYGRLVAFFEGMMNALSKAAHKAYAGQRADAKLDTLTKRLVLLEAKYQLRQQPSMMNDLLDGLEDKLTDVGESARKKLIELSQSSYLGGANNLYLKTAGNVVKMVAEQRVGYMLDNVEKIYNRSVKGQMGILGSLFNELRGTRDTNIMGRALMIKNKSREKEREDINRDIAKLLADPFKELSKKESDNITKVLLRTDVQALWGTFTDVEIRELLSRPAKLNAAIVQYQNQLPAALKTYYENQSDFTAFMLAVGEDKGDNTQLNIHNIADLSGTKQAGTLSDVEVEANIKVLDVLVTLKALKFTNEGDRQNMASLMLREPEGVKTALLMHRGLMEKARTETFVGTERLMRKGYVPEIHNPHVELVPVPEGAMEDYIKQGYKYHYHLPADPADVTYEPRVLMSVEKMTPRIVSGTLSITSMQSQGSAVHSGLEMYDFSGVNTFNQHTNKRIAKKREQHIDRLFKAPHGKNLFDMQVTRMTPISNPNGEMVGYRYMMSHENRDILLERNNNFAQVLAEMASTVFDKQTTPVHNREVLTAIKDQWEIEQSVNPEAFLLVGLDSADKDLRERYLAIPYETRKDIARIWGDNNMMIRRDLIDLHLGYRKASLTDLLTDNGKHEGIVKDFFLWLAKDVFNISPKGLRRILKAENIIMAVNQEIKDFFVVKSGVTTFWNIVSNLTLLKLYGVSIQEIVRSHKTALMGARDWQKHDSELRRLKAMKDSGLVIGSSSEMDQQIAVLEDQMARNPVREVMMMGMMPTIVEDMDAAEDPYSYKSYAARKAEKVTQYIPGFVKQGAKWVYMTHDTGLYQIMSQGAQMSDFVARYTLFEHLKTRRKNPLATGEAAIQAIDAFINYDLPSNRWVQYANDMGIVRFTKYYLRIQAVLAHLYQNNPARALFLATIENYFSGLQTVMDSSLWNRIGSPLEGGPFDALEAIESGLVSRMLGKVF